MEVTEKTQETVRSNRIMQRRLKWLEHVLGRRDERNTKIRGSQVVIDQEEDHRRDAWTVLKIAAEPVYWSLWETTGRWRMTWYWVSF